MSFLFCHNETGQPVQQIIAPPAESSRNQVHDHLLRVARRAGLFHHYHLRDLHARPLTRKEAITMGIDTGADGPELEPGQQEVLDDLATYHASVGVAIRSDGVAVMTCYRVSPMPGLEDDSREFVQAVWWVHTDGRKIGHSPEREAEMRSTRGATPA